MELTTWYYKLGKACVTNRGSFVLLQIRATDAFLAAE